MQRVWAALGMRPATPRITSQDRAILDLKLQRDKIRQYQRRIEGVLAREHEIARACVARGQKERALLALRRRAHQEGLLRRTDGQLEQLEQLVSTIEFSLVEAAVLHGLQQGNAALAAIHKEMSIERVEVLLGETQEAIAYQREIDEMLRGQMTADEEDAVLLELAELQREAAGPIVLPDAPRADPVSHESVAIHDGPVEEPARDRVALPAS